MKIAQREKEKIEQSTKKDVLVIEQDYLNDETLEVAMDVYNIFIAANMTKACDPMQLTITLQKVIFVWLV